MTILIAPDKFKGTLTAKQVAKAIQKGIKSSFPAAKFLLHPLADGGDGSLDILTHHLPLTQIERTVPDPLGRPRRAAYAYHGSQAFIELARASGIIHLPKEVRNPLQTHILGTGALIADALDRGLRHIYLFLGGSCTNEAGMGIAHFLGYRFLDREGKVLAPIGGNLSAVDRIDDRQLRSLEGVHFYLLCDVQNPMYGPRGAAYTYGPQKGAQAEQVEILDRGLRHFAQKISDYNGRQVGEVPGGGAAGAISAGLLGLLPAELRRGFATIAEITQLAQQLPRADWVISGEGRLDASSLQGKVVQGVADYCRAAQKPMIALVGSNQLSPEQLRAQGIRAAYSVLDRARELEDALRHGASYLEAMAADWAERELRRS
ncbi:MAG: glycerate kinase [Bacteroidota bacterium]